MSIQNIPATDDVLLDLFIHHNLILHPLPWRIEMDWTFEVYGSDNALIVKCMNPAQANAVVKLANKEGREQEKFFAGLERGEVIE